MPRQYSFNFLLTIFSLFFCGIACHRQNPPPPAASLNPPQTVASKQIIPITNMVAIKPGSFLRGKFRVTLTHGYWIGKYEVTQGEYMALMGKNPSNFEGDTNRPVEKVKFTEAQAYCATLTKREMDAGHLQAGYSYRLPTEAEWEYACRAGTTNLFSFGDDAKDADQYVWYLDNSDGTTHPVGQKKPNPWGLYDMHGNVWEWCNDWFERFPQKDLQDPVGPATSKFKVFHGGSWNHAIEFARAGNRFMMAPDMGVHFVGFRVLLGSNLPPPSASTLRK